MNEWANMATDSLDAAKELNDSGRVRSCLSRAYYSVYAAVTGELVGRFGEIGPGDRPNPTHDQMATMAAHNLDNNRFSRDDRIQIKRAVKRLRGLRIEADYDPSAAIATTDAVRALKLASGVMRLIEERRSQR